MHDRALRGKTLVKATAASGERSESHPGLTLPEFHNKLSRSRWRWKWKPSLYLCPPRCCFVAGPLGTTPLQSRKELPRLPRLLQKLGSWIFNRQQASEGSFERLPRRKMRHGRLQSLPLLD